jgi:alpha-mannosidase
VEYDFHWGAMHRSSRVEDESGNPLLHQWTAGSTETGCRAVVIDDPSDTWSHEIRTFSREIGAFENAEIKILENGPLRATLRVTSVYGSSKLAIDWMLCAGSRNLEARVTLDWYEHLKMLKFSFPVDVESSSATYETPYGYIVREVNGNEDPGQRWIDVTGKRNNNNYGLTVINDAKYGYSVLENDMRISAVRSAVYAHHDPKVLDMNAEHLWMDQGIQTFRMLLVPHPGTWKDCQVARVTEEFIAPAVPIYQGIHGGLLPKAGSFLAINAPNIIVSAVKLAEDGDDVIIRCVESDGEKTSAVLNLAFANRQWKGNFNPFEIKTLRMDRKSGDLKEVDLLEE